MRVLVSTKETQGRRANDYSYVDEGELVTFGTECDREAVDGRCGCRRAMCGVLSHKATTTFKVADLPMTEADLRDAVASFYKEGGWADICSEDAMGKILDEDVRLLLQIASGAPVGTVVEKRGTAFKVRPVR